MRREEVEQLAERLEYGKAKYRLTRVTNPDLRKRYEEIVSNYETKYSINIQSEVLRAVRESER